MTDGKEKPEQQARTKETGDRLPSMEPRQQPSALFARANGKAVRSPQRSSSKIKEKKHPFALYGWGEKQTDTGSQRTHNVCASAPVREVRAACPLLPGHALWSLGHRRDGTVGHGEPGRRNLGVGCRELVGTRRADSTEPGKRWDVRVLGVPGGREAQLGWGVHRFPGPVLWQPGAHHPCGCPMAQIALPAAESALRPLCASD